MPRAPGQIDLAKNEAILEAAHEILAERGLSAPMSAIARRAGVSKQTIYNHYGAKTDLIRALVNRRSKTVTAPLQTRAPGGPEETLASYARALLAMISAPRGYSLMKLTIQSAGELPELAREVYEAGPRSAHRRLASFLKGESEAGRLAIGDPLEAAEIFSGMAIGHKQIRLLMGLPIEMDEEALTRFSNDVAHRFVRAYAPN